MKIMSDNIVATIGDFSWWRPEDAFAAFHNFTQGCQNMEFSSAEFWPSSVSIFIKNVTKIIINIINKHM